MSAKSTIAWFVCPTSIKNPVQVKIRVTMLNPTTFKYKGNIYRVTDDGAKNVATGEFIRGRIRKTDKQRTKEWIESECRRACDPNSDLYWSM